MDTSSRLRDLIIKEVRFELATYDEYDRTNMVQGDAERVAGQIMNSPELSKLILEVTRMGYQNAIDTLKNEAIAAENVSNTVRWAIMYSSADYLEMMSQ